MEIQLRRWLQVLKFGNTVFTWRLMKRGMLTNMASSVTGMMYIVKCFHLVTKQRAKLGLSTKSLIQTENCWCLGYFTNLMIILQHRGHMTKKFITLPMLGVDGISCYQPNFKFEIALASKIGLFNRACKLTLNVVPSTLYHLLYNLWPLLWNPAAE